MCSLKNLAIIGASYLQLPLILKAKEMGFTTHVFAWAADDVGEKAADYFHPISTIEKESITEKCKEIEICGICSIATDIGNITVNYVANQLGLTCNSMESTYKSTKKHLMRKAFKENGDPSPRSVLIDKHTEGSSSSNLSSLGLAYPVIVKPIDRSGSRGICKVDSQNELQAAIQTALSEGIEKKVLIEEFVEGQEYSVEGISFNGVHHILAITLKYTTGSPHFIETGHLEPAPISKEMARKIEAVVVHALNTLEIRNSASHSEIKIDKDGNIKIIEIGSRMGGDCIGSDLVYYSTGIDYLKAVIQVACGMEPDLKPNHEPMSVEVRFIFTEEDVTEMKRLQQDTDRFIKLVAFYPENIGHTTDSSNRAGCYIVRSESLIPSNFSHVQSYHSSILIPPPPPNKNLSDFISKSLSSHAIRSARILDGRSGSMSRILIIGTGAFQIPLIEKSYESYETYVVGPAIDEAIKKQVSGYLIEDVKNKERILQYAKEKKVNGIVTDQSDIPVRTVAYVAEQMGLPGIGYEKACLFSDKSLMRKKLEELGIATLPNKTVSSLPEALSFYDQIQSKIILKPSDSQGSRGVSLCENKADVKQYFSEAIKWSSNGQVVAEKFAVGKEFVVEGIAFNGKFSNLICGDTEYFNVRNAFAAKHRIFPANVDQELMDKVYALNKSIIDKFALPYGITHSEFIMDRDGIYLLETAARGGGVFTSSEIIKLMTGLDVCDFLLKSCLGLQKTMPEFVAAQMNPKMSTKRSAEGSTKSCVGYLACYAPQGRIVSIAGKDEVTTANFVHMNQLNDFYIGREYSGSMQDKTARSAIIISAKDRNEWLERADWIKETLRIKFETNEGLKGLIWD